MERKEGQNGPLPEDVCREFGRCEAGSALFRKELHAYKKMFNEDETMDESYKLLLVSLFTKGNQFIVPQKTKRDDKLEPLLPILRYKRSEQLLKRGQYLREHGCVRENASKDRLAEHDDEDVFCENAGTGLKEGFEMPTKRKGKGLLIHYDDVNVNEVVGEGYKKQNGKDHLIEPEDVREDSEKTIFEPHKRGGKHCLIGEKDDVREKAFELEKKRKGKGLLIENVGENGGKDRVIEHDHKLRENATKTSKERFEPREMQNRKAPEARSEPPLIKPKDNKAKEYGIFLKLMNEYKQSRSEAIPKNVATVKIEEGVGSNKDNELEPKRQSTGIVKPDVEHMNQVPNPVKRPNAEKSNMEMEKRPTRRSRKIVYEGYSSDEDESREADIEKRSSRRSMRVVCKEYSSDEDEEVVKKICPACRSRKAILEESGDEYDREEIDKRSSREVRSISMKKPKNENVEADIEKRSSRRSKKVVYKEYSSDEDEGVGIEERHAHRSRKAILEETSDEDEREEIENCSSRKVRSITMKKPKNENAKADIEKCSYPRSRKVIRKEYLSYEDEDVGIKKLPACRSRKAVLEESSDEDNREVIMKRLSREVMKKSKNKNTEADIEKRPSHQSGKVVYKGYSSGEADKVGFKKSSARRSTKAILEEMSDEDERERIKKRSSRKVRNVIMKNPKNEKAEIEKHSSHRPRKVVYEDYSSNEDEDENVGVRIKNCPARRSRKAVLKRLSDEDNYENREIEKCSSCEVRNVLKNKPKDEKTESEIDKCSSRRSKGFSYLELSDEDTRIEKSLNESSNKTEMLFAKCAAREYKKLTMKRPRSEGVEEEIERSRDILLKRSRYEVEGCAPRGLTNFRAGESSMRHKRIEEDSSEEDKESSDDDSDVEILDGDKCLNGPFEPSTKPKIIEDNGFRLSEDYMKFRSQVLEVISKPYDKGEYKALLKEFQGQRYPGYHQDLVKKLKRNRWNPRKRLAILRGFFFWLQNLTRKGSFKPWHDGICLQVEPERPPRYKRRN